MMSESSSPRAGQAPRVPISLEGERRKAMKLIYAMEKDCTHFLENWLLTETCDHVDEWVELVTHVKNRSGGNGTFSSYKEFEKELERLRAEQKFLGISTTMLLQLQRVCERAKGFERLFELSHMRIEDALAHYMGKYCLSFFAEIEDMNIECVRDYENSINEWQVDIQCCLGDAEKAMATLQDLTDKPFVDYLKKYDKVLQAMHSAIDAFVSVCDPFRSWVTADEGYIKKVRLELACLEGQKARVSEALRKKSFKVHEQKAQELRTDFQNKKLGEKVQGTVSGRRFCRNREFSFVDKIEITENVLHEKKLKLEEARGKVNARPLHSLVREPTDGMKDKSAKLHQEVQSLERQVERMKKGKRDMRETRYHLQKEYHFLKGKYESCVKKARRQTDQFKDHIQHIKDESHRQRLLERKIRALESIIYIKTHPATVKKIYFDGYVNGERIDFRDTLREAIGVAAAGVGKDWDKMYQHLPFHPPRNTQRRNQDLELLDMDFKSIHPPSEQMALRSLDKWKSLSSVTSVNALVRTLKSIKKTEVAKRIEKQVLTVVN